MTSSRARSAAGTSYSGPRFHRYSRASSSLTTDADRNRRSGLTSSVNWPVCRSNTAMPAVTPGGTTAEADRLADEVVAHDGLTEAVSQITLDPASAMDRALRRSNTGNLLTVERLTW